MFKLYKLIIYSLFTKQHRSSVVIFITKTHLNFQIMSGSMKKASSVIRTVWKVSPAMTTVLGKSESTRMDALKGVWAYIKDKNLQNPEKKREIIGDDAITNLFGKKNTTMFEVMKLMNPHFLEKK